MNLKRTHILIIVITAAALTAAGCSKGYESQKNAADLEITLKADRYPLVKGKNTLTINVIDSAKKPVTDATVQVRYYMPPMSGMAPMEFNTAAAPKGKGYQFTADIPAEGPWKIDVMVTLPGKPVLTSTFNIDAR